MSFESLFVAALIVLVPSLASAGIPECDALSGNAAVVASAVMQSEYMYDCCDDTIAKCLAGRPGCRSAAQRMARHVCRRAAAGDAGPAIKRSLDKRAISVTGSKADVPAVFEPGAVAGNPDAPVTIVMYTCARCPFCSRLVPQLHREAVTGRLAGLVRLVIRPFPIKSHPNSAEANHALTVAVKVGRGWQFLLEAYRRFDSFSLASIPDVVVAAGIDLATFEAALSAPESRQLLVDVKKEGLRLGVESTPTLFIDGRHFQSELDIETVVDVVLELLEGKSVQPAGLK